MTNVDSIKIIPDKSRWLYLSGVWLIYFVFGLMMFSLAPIVSIIIDDLSITSTQMGSILGAWPLIYIIMAIPCGAFVDRAGLKLALFLAALIMALSGLLRAISFDYLTMFFSVSLFGIGGPLISIGAPKLIADYFIGKERGLAMGIYITGPAFGSIFALSTTNSIFMPIFENNWREVILVFSFFVFLSSGIWLYLSRGIQIKNSEQINFNIFKQLTIYLNLIKLKNVQILLLMSVCIFFYSHGLFNWLPEILRMKNMTLSQAGYWASLPTLAGIIGSLLIPRIATRDRRMFIFFILILSAIVSTLLLLFDWLPLLSTGLILQGISRATLMTIAILILMESPGVKSDHMGAAGGLFFTFAEIGGVLGPLSMGKIFDITGNFDLSLIFMTLVTVLLILFFFYLNYNNKKIIYKNKS
ncbi:MAG: putative glucarate transporter [Alphaproteobacteria bacterium MarineAlpha2_Bin1]|nr:MAG: putative glucarate transporter [Alphaproteobacteria bacterium MarineAlpha2_Bin1]